MDLDIRSAYLFASYGDQHLCISVHRHRLPVLPLRRPSSKCKISFPNVVFPQPDSPTIPIVSPAYTVKLISSTAFTFLFSKENAWDFAEKYFETCLTSKKRLVIFYSTHNDPSTLPLYHMVSNNYLLYSQHATKWFFPISISDGFPF